MYTLLDKNSLSPEIMIVKKNGTFRMSAIGNNNK